MTTSTSTPSNHAEHFGHEPSFLLTHLLATISTSIIPLTTSAVSRGCKVFGASILSKSTLSPIVSATNDEMTSPLLHGETNTLLQFHAHNAALPADQRVDPKDCIFLSTHEPCSLCLSAITWSGFDNFYYCFTYEDTKQLFAIPHDLRILREVFQTQKSEEGKEEVLYNKKNAYWSSYSLEELIEQSPEGEREALRVKLEAVKREYNSLSETYQQSKSAQLPGQIPLA